MKKLSLITAIISPIIVTTIFCVTRILYYPITDDYIFNFISKGTYTGEPNAYLICIKYPIGWIIKNLYNIAGSINWFGIMYLLIILICTYTLTSVLKKYVNDWLAIFISLLLNIVMLCWITFTVLAYFCIGIAIIKGLDTISNPENKRTLNVINIAATVFLIVMSYAIRDQAFLSGAFSLSAITIIIIVYFRKNIKISYLLIIGALSISVLFSIFIADKQAYSSEGWTDFLHWQKQRVATSDYPIGDYNKNINFYKQLGVSKNDYYGLPDYYEADKEFYSTERMRRIAEGTPKNERYNLNVLNIIWSMAHAKELWALLIICFICILLDKEVKRKIAYALQAICTMGVVGITYFIQRPTERVSIPLYGLGIIAIAYLFFRKNNILATKIHKVCGVVGTILLIGITLLYGNQAVKVKNFKENNIRYSQALIRYMKDNPEKLFVFRNYHHILFNEPVLNIKKSTTYENVMELSNYELYNDTYYKKVKQFKLKYPNRLQIDVAENDNVYYVEYGKWKVDNVVKYIEEHMEKDVETRVVKSFDNSDIKIYKVKYK